MKTKTCKLDGTSWTAPKGAGCPTCQDNDALLLGAIARGWCSKKNKKKVMDSDLANAIALEVGLFIRKHHKEERERTVGMCIETINNLEKSFLIQDSTKDGEIVRTSHSSRTMTLVAVREALTALI
jgi:hypothetical protein